MALQLDSAAWGGSTLTGVTAGATTNVRAITFNAVEPVAQPPQHVVLERVGDMDVIDEQDSIRRFRLVVHAKPWPRAGDRVGFDLGDTTFRGFVTRTELRCHSYATCRWVMTIEGYVEEFDGKAVFD